MKKLFLFLLLFIGVSTVTFSQEKSGSSSRRRVFKQKSHFDKQKNDPNIKHNGTSVRRNKKSKYTVDGDGFTEAKQKRRKRGKKTGIK
jgi:hypothetical protein